MAGRIAGSGMTVNPKIFVLFLHLRGDGGLDWATVAGIEARTTRFCNAEDEFAKVERRRGNRYQGAIDLYGRIQPSGCK